MTHSESLFELITFSSLKPSELGQVLKLGTLKLGQAKYSVESRVLERVLNPTRYY